MVATSATRDASNAADFTGLVREVLGVAPEVITGDEEARLSFTGATAELGGAADAAGPQPPYLVVDIGGGSTEFVLGGEATGQPPVAALSVNIGCVRLTERHLRSDPPTAAQIAEQRQPTSTGRWTRTAAAAVAVGRRPHSGRAGWLGDNGDRHSARPAAITTRAGFTTPGMSAASVHQVTTQLLSQTREQRAAIGSMHPGRVDVIGAGSLILDRIMERFGFAEEVTSEHDILDGIAWSLVSRV